MYVCMFTYINIHTLYPLVSLIHIHTRNRLRKTEEYFGFKKKRKKRNEKELAWKNVGSCKRARLHFPNFRKRDSSLARVYLTKRGAHIHSLWRILHSPATTDAYRLLHTHTHSYIFDATRVKPCMYRRAIARACKSRNYNASRGENARVIRLILRF